MRLSRHISAAKRADTGSIPHYSSEETGGPAPLWPRPDIPTLPPFPMATEPRHLPVHVGRVVGGGRCSSPLTYSFSVSQTLLYKSGLAIPGVFPVDRWVCGPAKFIVEGLHPRSGYCIVGVYVWWSCMGKNPGPIFNPSPALHITAVCFKLI